MTVSQVRADGTVCVTNNIKVEAILVTLSQVTDDGTVSVTSNNIKVEVM